MCVVACLFGAFAVVLALAAATILVFVTFLFLPQALALAFLALAAATFIGVVTILAIRLATSAAFAVEVFAAHVSGG